MAEPEKLLGSLMELVERDIARIREWGGEAGMSDEDAQRVERYIRAIGTVVKAIPRDDPNAKSDEELLDRLMEDDQMRELIAGKVAP